MTRSQNSESRKLNASFHVSVLISKQFSRLRAETARKTDVRIGIMNEIIDGIKVIKMYAWEHAFAKSIGDARR